MVSSAQSPDYLLEELRLLNSLRANATEQSGVRVDVFFLTVTGIAGIGAWLSTGRGFTPGFLVGLAFLNLILLVLGVLSFLRLLEAHFSIVTYMRGINRIRAYFLNHQRRGVHLSRALMLPRYDDRPFYGGFGFGRAKVHTLGLAGIMVLLNSVLAGSFAAMMVALTIGVETLAICEIGLIVLVLAMLAMRRYAQAASANREKWFNDEMGVLYPAPKG